MATNVPNPGSYIASIGLLFTGIRDQMADVQFQSQYIASMGGAAFLTAAFPEGLGMSENDALALIASLGNMSVLATAYQGGPQAPQMNYEANTQPFWGGN
jgi:hypothetical protein